MHVGGGGEGCYQLHLRFRLIEFSMQRFVIEELGKSMIFRNT